MRATRAAVTAAEWDEVWAEYDARRPAVAPAAMPAARPAVPPLPRPPGRGAILFALSAAAAAGWLLASAATVWQVAEAVERRDPAALARHLDTGAVQAALRESLLRMAGQPEGEAASAFLGGMAQEMAAAWSDPAALAEVAAARGVVPGAAAEGIRGARPVGLTALDLPIGTATAPAPLTLRLELREAGMAPRWQVTQVRIGAEAREAPPLRLSQLR